MAEFHLYAKYYDLLYKDKDYRAEAEYVSDLIKQNCPDAKLVLNLGCGTGKHDFELAVLGYNMTGVDLSADMIAVANEHAKNFNGRVHFEQGDIRQLKLGRKFDAVISLFHVMSYQTSNDDIANTLKTVMSHLKEGGVFIFDCWYGPGVLTDLPVVRIKRLRDENLKIIRLAEPVMHPNENVVDVNYTIMFDEPSQDRTTIKERHHMRYLFVPEVKNMLRQAGLDFVGVFDWMGKGVLTMHSWNACFIGKNNAS